MNEHLRSTGRNFIVIGDLMLDEYYIGTVSRLSPEAPVPILDVTNHMSAPGGAANVAMNLAKLGNRVELLGVVGKDEAGQKLLKLLKCKGIGTDGILCINGLCTTRKLRFATHQQALLRVDYENRNQIKPHHCEKLINFLKKYLRDNTVNGVLISDYNKGLFCKTTSALWKPVLSDIKHRSIYCGADSKQRGTDLSLFSGFDFLKPNLSELYKAVGKGPEDGYSLEDACREYLKLSQAKTLFVTMGEQGIFVFDGLNGKNIDAVKSAVKDATGAGDAVFAVLLFTIVNGFSCVEAAKLSNIAASVIIEKPGTAVISFDDLRERVDSLENVSPEYFIN